MSAWLYFKVKVTKGFRGMHDWVYCGLQWSNVLFMFPSCHLPSLLSCSCETWMFSYFITSQQLVVLTVWSIAIFCHLSRCNRFLEPYDISARLQAIKPLYTQCEMQHARFDTTKFGWGEGAFIGSYSSDEKHGLMIFPQSGNVLDAPWLTYSIFDRHQWVPVSWDL